MKPKVFLLLFFTIFSFSGCSASNKMVVYKSSPESCRMSRTVYDNYFEGKTDIFDNKINVYIKADMIKKNNPFYGLQAAMGALSSEDLYADADIVISFTNTSKEIFDIRLWDFYVWDDDLMGKRYDPIDYPQVSFSLLPNRNKTIEINKYEIGHYCEILYLKINFEVNGEVSQQSFEVPRHEHIK